MIALSALRMDAADITNKTNDVSYEVDKDHYVVPDTHE